MDVLINEMTFPSGDHLWVEETKPNEYVDNNICNGCGSLMVIFSQVVNQNGDVGLETSLCAKCGFTKRTRNLSARSFASHFSKKWLARRDEYICENGYVYGKLNGFIPTKGKVLDVGCGLGGSLLAFKKAGYDVYGVEPSKHRSEIGMEAMENIVTGTAEKYLSESTDKFDVIYFFNVLQFLDNPYKVLKLASERLTENGKIWFKLGVYNHRTNFSHFAHIGMLRNYINLYSIIKVIPSWGLYPVYYQQRPFEVILSKRESDVTGTIIKSAQKLDMQSIEKFAKKTLNYRRLKFFGETKLLYLNRSTKIQLKKPVDSLLPVRFIHKSNNLPIILK